MADIIDFTQRKITQEEDRFLNKTADELANAMVKTGRSTDIQADMSLIILVRYDEEGSILVDTALSDGANKRDAIAALNIFLQRILNSLDVGEI